MSLTEKSKIRDVWRHPVGHDLLQTLMRNLGKESNWPEKRGYLPLRYLDRLVCKGFSGFLADIIDKAGTPPPPVPQPETPMWWKEAVIYQIYLPSFMDSDHDGMGDLGGVLQRLPYLEALGVTVLWICPLLDAVPVGERGIRNFRQISEEFGDMEQLEMLIAELHERGMKLVISMDIASTSDQHEWFLQALKQPKNKYRDYYVFRKGQPDVTPNQWGRLNAFPSWNWYSHLSSWALRLLGRHRMDLNWDNPEVRKEMQDVVRFWEDKGVDGICLLSVNLISKHDYGEGSHFMSMLLGGNGTEKYSFGPKMNDYLQELCQKSIRNPNTLVMGEVRGIGTEAAKLFTGAERHEFNMILDTGFLTYPSRLYGEKNTHSLKELRNHYVDWMQSYGNNYWMPILFENAEMPRMVGRVGANPVYKSILAKMLATMMMTMRGTPILYQGQELGVGNTRFKSLDEMRSTLSKRMHRELRAKQPEKDVFERVLGHAPDHARVPMPWSAGETGGFTGAVPWMRVMDDVEHTNASVQMHDPRSVWGHYHKLMQLRRKHRCLVYGKVNPVFTKNKNVFCYFRSYDKEKWYIEINLTEKELDRPGGITPTQRLVLSNYHTQAFTLRPYEANVYQCE